MKQFILLILAAGKGTRLKSGLPKVLHHLAGKPLIEYVLDASRPLGPSSTLIVVGYEAEAVKSALAGVPAQFIDQVPQLGTGHAVQLAKPHWESHRGTILILSGDVPLISTHTLKSILETHWKTRPSVTLLSTFLEDPTGYGRVVRNSRGDVERVVEQKDASVQEQGLKEINTGIYCFEIADLVQVIGELSAANAQGEYYLTDSVGLLRRRNKRVGVMVCEDPLEAIGINSRIELAQLEQVLRGRKIKQLMLEGVTIVDPASTYVALDVRVGRDTVLYPNVFLEKGSLIGSRCQIYPNVRISNSVLEDNVIVLDSSLISESRIQSSAQIGPFAHLRRHTVIGKEARIGNFVEVKKSEIGDKTKAAHLSYLGDAQIGQGVNIGAGTITCNYDGVSKHPTVIEDHVFVGSDSQLIAPVTIHRNAYVAAGSSICEDVPEDSLAIARSRQVIKENWARKRRETRRKG
ncbi:MAG: bifunctional UDP-N-acetylglucosamine diphosphorylase/glucosamine-1-phosphate N-acetyltransferase GlmU [Acidobacteria bacterium]|nr:MAG: bifunctional UDP-N-acetylglucosamine diphosphorylase/glucosamine-1-phosphate N-acetyltransferase GlmU [Acidobacteriota bacterium]